MYHAFEFEFAMPHNTENDVVNALTAVLDKPLSREKDGHTTRWNLFAEEIIDLPVGKVGMELNSPIYTKYPLKMITSVLKTLKDNDCSVTDCCGLHLHFSGRNCGDLVEFYQRIRGPIVPRECRVRWCDPKNFFLNNARKPRYRPINLIDNYTNHIEVRLANGTLSERTVFKHWKNVMIHGYGLKTEEVNTMIKF